MLTDAEKETKQLQTMKATATFFLHQYDAGGEGFLSQTVMWDETRVHHLEPKSKQQSME